MTRQNFQTNGLKQVEAKNVREVLQRQSEESYNTNVQVLKRPSQNVVNNFLTIGLNQSQSSKLIQAKHETQVKNESNENKIPDYLRSNGTWQSVTTSLLPQVLNFNSFTDNSKLISQNSQPNNNNSLPNSLTPMIDHQAFNQIAPSLNPNENRMGENQSNNQSKQVTNLPVYFQSNLSSPHYVQNDFSSPNYVQNNVTNPNYVQNNVTSPNYVQNNVTSPNYAQNNVTNPNYVQNIVTNPPLNFQNNLSSPQYVQKDFSSPNYVQNNVTSLQYDINNVSGLKNVQNNVISPKSVQNNVTSLQYDENRGNISINKTMGNPNADRTR